VIIMKPLYTLDNLHPMVADAVKRIQDKVIQKHKVPMRLFETGRNHERHAGLIKRGKTRDIVSKHLFNLENDPPLYATAIDYVYFDNKWSWNLRDGTVAGWYVLFGNLVLDVCPELEWYGLRRKSINYCHFQLRRHVLLENLKKIPCVVP
jgi:hypothetical protein